jgi:hypothetical protein
MGRPPLLPKIREVVRELIDRNQFTSLNKKEIENIIRREAKQRFPASFPKADTTIKKYDKSSARGRKVARSACEIADLWR